MGSALGTSPGRLVETNADGDIIHEWPEDVESTLNILGEQFSPHGLTVSFDKDLILTSDFVVPLSILKPTLGIQRADTLRLWKLSTKKILSTITIPNVRSPKTLPQYQNLEKAILVLRRPWLICISLVLGRWYSRREVHSW